MAVSPEQMARINELARKSKAEGLTEAEKVEQHDLRMAYVAAVKASLTPLLESITLVEVDEAGNQTVVRKAEITHVHADAGDAVIVEETVVKAELEEAHGDDVR